ncbi:MAG: hypothetical protein IJ242_17160, partial [Clostridia bacterium]|nr:hypothetical protein [Clostridia bacterium]
TFNDDAAIPSEAKIVFWATRDMTNDQKWTNNKVSAKIPDVEKTFESERGTGYYANLELVKQLNGLNQDTGTFEWQFTLTANKDVQNSKESINGYTITDPAFVGLTQDQINAIGYNAYFGDTMQVSSLDDTKNKYDFTIKKSSTDSDTITITFNEEDATYNKDTPLNKLKLYWNTTIQDYLSPSDWEKYQKGELVGLYNQATAKSEKGTLSADSGKIGQDIQQRIKAEKSYSGNKDESVLGNEDQAKEETKNRVLNWSVSMTKDTGFLGGDVYYDVFIGESNVPHYITPSQRTYITEHIVGAVTTGDNNTRGNVTGLDSSMYDIKFYTDSELTQEAGATENAVGFKVIFKQNDTLATYHHVYIDYQTTAETSKVKFGEKVTFSNSYSFNNEDPKPTVGLTFERKDPTKIPNTQLTLNKKWNDSGNALGTRPDSITVKVEQAEAGEDGKLPNNPTWVPYPDSDTSFTLTASASNGTDTFTLDGEFPQWKYDSEHDKITYYYYKIKEEPITGYILEETGEFKDQVKAFTENTFTLVNKSTADFGKVAVDSSGNRITQVDLSDSSEVPVVTLNIDGTPTKCYMFRWSIIVNHAANSNTTYTDTFSDDNVYYVSGEGVDAKYHPLVYYADSSSGTDFYQYAKAWYIGSAQQNGTQLTINLKSSSAIDKFVYYTAVPVAKIASSLDADGNLVNRVSKNSETSTIATLKVNGDVPDTETEPIQKSAEAAGQGLIKYSINFNPDGKKLSNSDNGTVDITDVLSFLGGKHGESNTDISLDELSFELDEIDMYPLVGDEADTSNSMKAQLGYTVEYKTETAQQMDVSKWAKYDTDGKIWRTTALSPGDQLTLVLKYQSSKSNNQLNLFAKTVNNENLGQVDIGYNKLSLDQSSGITEVSMTVPSASAYVYELNDYQSSFEIVSATITKTVPAVLTLTVPDETPVQIVYSYRVDGWTPNATGNAANDDVVKFGNTASFEEANGDGDSSVDENDLNTSGAKVQALRYPKIYKTEYGNDNLDYLSASFAVAKYDVETKQWVYLKSIRTITTGAGTTSEKNHRELTFPDSPYTGYLEADDKYPTGTALLKFAEKDDESTKDDKENVHEFDLKSNTLYKFVEIVAPTGYTQPNWTNRTLTDNASFVFYYAYDDFDRTKAPAEAKGNINSITEGKRINIKNSKNITIQAEKTFSGSDDKLPQVSEVTFRLYWANNKKGTGMKLVTSDTIDVAANYDPVKKIEYKAENETNTATWSDLPTGNRGSAVYYFVREWSYKDKNGTLYTYD